MAYSKPTLTQYKRIASMYGEESREYVALKKLEAARLPIEAVAEYLGWSLNDVTNDLTGGFPLPATQHNTLIDLVLVLTTIGVKHGVLPCRDNAILVPLLKSIATIFYLSSQSQQQDLLSQ